MSKALRIATFLAALCALGAVATPAGATETGAKPGWRLAVIPYPTNFIPGAKSARINQGPGYAVVATNTGAAPTEGRYTITDTLPAGVAPSPSQAPFGGFGAEFGRGELSCEAVGQTVSCSTEEALYPGQQATADFPLEVEAGAPESLIDHAVVEGGGAEPASAAMPTTVSEEAAPLGFLDEDKGARGSATEADGSTSTLAGSHPYQLTVGMNISNNLEGGTVWPPGGGPRDLVGEIPQGMLVNPTSVPRCKEAEFESETGSCPRRSQIGLISVDLGVIDERPSIAIHALYNMTPPPGVPAEFAFEVFGGIYIHLLAHVRSDGDYGLAAGAFNLPAQLGVLGNEVSFWGDPSDSGHDHVRAECTEYAGNCPLGEELDIAGVTLPSSCTPEPIDTLVKLTSWIGEEARASYPSTDANGNPVGVDGCNQLRFEPELEARPTTNLADSPTGLEFDIHQPQEESYEGRATANLKNVKVTLPEGMVINPSAAAGLGACSEEELGADGTKPQSCPDASKVASAEVKTALLNDPLPGALYLAKPYSNRFGSLLALYLVIEDPVQGIVAKVPGKVELDQSTGQLTAIFKESPELPLEDIRLHFYPGARAALTTPSTCGTYTTTSDLTPWSTPEGADAHPTDTFQTTVSPTGGACPGSEAGAPNAPAFSAGTVSPAAGAYSPFVLHLSRADGTQRLAGIDTTLPEGLVGKLAGIPYCSEADIAKARSREAPNQGAAEIADPSCPAASEVGTIDNAAGSGPTPFHVGGHLYLSGPYKGGPLSMVAIVPAVAGPFDLGDVVVRIALHVNPETTRIQAVSDPLPQIIDGIPLDLRSIDASFDRPSFTLNPTSCDPMAVGGTATTALGGSVALSSPFQVGGCNALGFKPKLNLHLSNGKRRAFPALKAVYTPKAGDANLKDLVLTLPHTEFIEQGHFNTICTRVQFAAGGGNGEQCPAGSIYGEARIYTPLLEAPLEGPVYLRSSTHKLPDAVFAANGQIDAAIVAHIDSVKGHLRATIEEAPDVPVTKAIVSMRGGKKGLFINSTDLCAGHKRKAGLSAEAHNAKTSDQKPVVRANKCGGKKKRHHKRAHHRHR